MISLVYYTLPAFGILALLYNVKNEKWEGSIFQNAIELKTRGKQKYVSHAR
ncbi:hypothetical protein IC582_002272 [Cucumis melo]